MLFCIISNTLSTAAVLIRLGLSVVWNKISWTEDFNLFPVKISCNMPLREDILSTNGKQYMDLEQFI